MSRFWQLTPADLDRLYDRLAAPGKRRGRCATAGITCRDHDRSPDLHDGIAPKTLTNVHGLLHKALVDAVERGKVQRNVAAPGAERPTLRWWSPDELRAVVTHVRGDRLYAAWLLLVTTGCVGAKVAGLAWGDVDLCTGMLTANRQLGNLDSRPTFAPRSDGRPAPSARRPSTYVSKRCPTLGPRHHRPNALFSRAPWSAVGSRPTRAWRNWQTRWV